MLKRIILLLSVFSLSFVLTNTSKSYAQENKSGFINNIFSKNDGVGDKQADFSLESSFNIVSSFEDKPSSALSDKVFKFLSKKGVDKAMQSQVVAGRNIVIKKVDKLDSNPQAVDAFAINVSKNRITIHFTSPLSATWAYNKFKTLYNNKENIFTKITKKDKRSIEGVAISDINGEDGVSDIIDMVVKQSDMAGAKALIEKCFKNDILTVYMVFISKDGWKVKSSSVMDLVNPKEDICKRGGYNYSDMEELNRYAKEFGIEIIPVLDFTTQDMSYFVETTGHSIHSIEGLRFTKAFIDEFCSKTSFETISLGFKTENADVIRKYIKPLVEIVEKNKITAIMN